MQKQKFKKYYNRPLSLLAVEYWHKGETQSLPGMTENQVIWKPLFVYKKDKAVDVYYDYFDPMTSEESLVEYFEHYPDKFNILMDEYEKECEEMINLSKNKNIQNFFRIFELHVSAWPKLSAVVILGELDKNKYNAQVVQRAYDLREKTDKIDYVSEKSLLGIVEKMLPEYKDFLSLLTFEEIYKNNIPDLNELKNRQDRYVYFDGKVSAGLNEKELAKLEGFEIDLDDELLNSQRHGQEIKGMPAMKGKANGRIKIMFSGSNFDNFNEGYILVAPMTTPDFLSVIKNAVAIVTDEGGITCHAAIVSRELKIPCIVGTKIATQVLKDGDLVEVDANEGVVRILESR